MVITVPWPPSINFYYIRIRTRVILHKRVNEFRKEVCYLLNNIDGKFSSEDRLSIKITLNPPNKRKFDLDNRLKGLLDALEYAGIFPNDEQIDNLFVTRGSVIKNGSVLIEIKKI